MTRPINETFLKAARGEKTDHVPVMVYASSWSFTARIQRD